MSSEVANCLREALATIRAFADKAEMIIKHHEEAQPGGDPEMTIGQVQAKLAWGLANASSSIQDALAMVAYEQQNNG